MRAFLSLLCAGVTWASLGAQPIAAAQPPTANCGVDLAAPQIQSAIDQLPPQPHEDKQWGRDAASLSGNFDACATLSAALVTLQGGTTAGPTAVLLFHHGQYVGTASEINYSDISLDPALTTDDTVAIEHYIGSSCPGCADYATASVRYQWQGDHVQQLDEIPDFNPWV